MTSLAAALTQERRLEYRRDVLHGYFHYMTTPATKGVRRVDLPEWYRSWGAVDPNEMTKTRAQLIQEAREDIAGLFAPEVTRPDGLKTDSTR